MNFTIQTKTLLSALKLTEKGINASGIMPATSCYRLYKSADKLIVETCNLEISMQTSIVCDVPEIDILIPAEKVVRLLSSLPEQPLQFTIADDNEITIKASSGEYALSGYSALDYPVINTQTNQSFTLPAENLTEAIYATAYARSVDATQFKFTGLSIIASKAGLQFAGCNLLLLSVFNVPGKFKDAKILLPPSIANTIGSLQIAGDVKISYGENAISFEYGNLTVKSLLMDEKYPDYMSIVPKNEIKISANRAELIAAIKRVLEFTNKERKISLTSDTNLTISGLDTAYKQRAYESVKLAEPNTIEISLNGGMLSEALSHFSSELIEIYWQAHDKAVVINEPGDTANFSMVMAMLDV